MPCMSLFLFGPPRNEVDGREVIVRRRKAKALLIYLAVTKSRHQREALAALLWPESDHNTRTNEPSPVMSGIPTDSTCSRHTSWRV